MVGIDQFEVLFENLGEADHLHWASNLYSPATPPKQCAALPDSHYVLASSSVKGSPRTRWCEAHELRSLCSLRPLTTTSLRSRVETLRQSVAGRG